MSVLFNVIVSGASVSGNLDTTSNEIRIEMGNADMIGRCSFELYNSGGQYSTTLLSGNPTVEIDVVRNSIAVPLFKGTVEKSIPQISIQKGSTVQFDGYDLGQELLNVISPDARVPYLLTASGTVNVLSGDGGAAAPAGMDLVIYTSGRNSSGNVPVSQFLSQWFGTSGDHTGSQSGVLLSFKPYVSGYTWNTYYWPDASGGVVANDNNANYFLDLDGMKARGEYAWDALRKVTRQQHVRDGTGSKVAFEMYTGVSGDIHVFASGSYERVASGAVLVYYAAPNSGQANNNIVNAKVPYDLTLVKNLIDGQFPAWQVYPYDSDAWSDFLAYSGGAWSGLNSTFNSGLTKISGGPPGPNGIGFISIISQTSGTISGSVGNVNTGLIYTLSGRTFNIKKLNVSGGGAGVSLAWLGRYIYSGGGGSPAAYQFLQIYDLSGNYIIRSGEGAGTQIGPSVTGPVDTGWAPFSQIIFTASGTFLSGGGRLDSGWAVAKDGGAVSGVFPDLTNVFQIKLSVEYNDGAATALQTETMAIDQLRFTFNYPFSPVQAFNSGSQALYGRRYAVLQWPDQISDGYASGLMNSELQARMGSQGIAEFIVHDNFNSNPISAQLGIKPGYIFVVDAPVLGTGSGQVFNLWRASKVMHVYSKSKGFESTIYAYPYYSGVGFSGTQNNNQINYMTPLVYNQVQPNPEREQYLPIGRPWQPGR